MAFASKLDRCGLLTALNPASGTAVIAIRDSNRNGSVQKYQPQGSNGDYVATEVYGDDSSPSCSYALAGDITATLGKIKLGKVTSITEGNSTEGNSTEGNSTTKKYGLESVNITTGAAAPVTISASSKQLEDSAADGFGYLVPAFSLSTRQTAQVLFDAFTLSGTGCQLTNCSANIKCNLNTDKLVGSPISSDVSAGVITISGAILRLNSTTGNTEPTITASTAEVPLTTGESPITGKWVVTKAPTPTESNPETAYQTYSFEVELCLVQSSIA